MKDVVEAKHIPAGPIEEFAYKIHLRKNVLDYARIDVIPVLHTQAAAAFEQKMGPLEMVPVEESRFMVTRVEVQPRDKNRDPYWLDYYNENIPWWPEIITYEFVWRQRAQKPAKIEIPREAISWRSYA